MSTLINPVTQTADVAVKYEVENGVALPLADEIGRHNKRLPKSIIPINPKSIILNGEIRVKNTLTALKKSFITIAPCEKLKIIILKYKQNIE